jgi:hypothetical protein
MHCGATLRQVGSPLPRVPKVPSVAMSHAYRPNGLGWSLKVIFMLCHESTPILEG